MQYVYNLLAVILIGLSIGAIMGQHNNAARFSGLVAIVLAVLAFFISPGWAPLAVGTAVFLVGQGMQRDHRGARV
ncbi:MAG TPA: hypothetical protein VL003_11210 [Pusillimonas sp.]|uniref:hypothetical protein n=1 Tax=Pusillimonas sp. TaxID=3040095 RepID=UPI002C6DA623|nr:hypothetical protein [Pusillimonas sp.]HUH88598.1 hypothetical protein [Pusillimonas sp.]